MTQNMASSHIFSSVNISIEKLGCVMEDGINNIYDETSSVLSTKFVKDITLSDDISMPKDIKAFVIDVI